MGVESLFSSDQQYGLYVFLFEGLNITWYEHQIQNAEQEWVSSKTLGYFVYHLQGWKRSTYNDDLLICVVTSNILHIK